MSDVKIEIRKNGPYVVIGPVQIMGPDGQKIETEEGRGRVSLCRCGRSGEKPFCDGTHNRSDWSDMDSA